MSLNEFLHALVHGMGWLMLFIAMTIFLCIGPGSHSEPKATKDSDRHVWQMLFFLMLFLIAFGAELLWLTWSK